MNSSSKVYSVSSFLSEGYVLQGNFTDFSNVKLDRSSILTWVDVEVPDLANSLSQICTQFEFNYENISSFLNKSGYSDSDSQLSLSIPSIILDGNNVCIEHTIILIKKGLILTIHNDKVKRFEKLIRYAKTILKKAANYSNEEDRLTFFLIRVFDENNGRNFDHLRSIQANSDHISQRLSDLEISRDKIGKDIHQMKHQLITYLGGLWESIDVLNSIRYGDPLLLSDDQALINHLGSLVDQINTQISLAEHMSEVLSSGLDVMQSIYNNHLQLINNRMALLVAYLTVIGTAVMVPNTLATALSSSVFNLTTNDQTWYISLMVISTIVATLISYWWVKKEGLLPNRPS
ncbi:MAG: CorA family divalent cation transporter [Candidatus Bilamarchaeum sp.]